MCPARSTGQGRLVVEEGFGMWTVQHLSSRLPDLMRKRAGCGLDARTVTKAQGEAMVHTRDLSEMLVLIELLRLGDSRFSIALHGELSSFRRNVVEFIAGFRHIRLAAWLGDAG